MLKLLTFIRHNAIALAALFVALGGTSYAAFNLPAGSVGSTQLKNHSITPSKLDPGSIGGYVRYWAWISAAGKIIAASPHAKLMTWQTNPTGPAFGGRVTWGGPIGPSCTSLATIATRPTEPGFGGSPGITTETFPAISGRHGFPAYVQIRTGGVEPVNVFVICAQP